jgi:hypothetical protein
MTNSHMVTGFPGSICQCVVLPLWVAATIDIHLDANSRTRIDGVPTPPYAMLKEIPEFPPDLLHKYARKVIVASAIMNTSGKLEQVSIPQNSEDAVVGPLLAALSHWLFQPAQIDGQPVSLKVLLGIRFSVPR